MSNLDFVRRYAEIREKFLPPATPYRIPVLAPITTKKTPERAKAFKPPKPEPTLSEIYRDNAFRHQLSGDEINSRDNSPHVVAARWEFFYLAMTLTSHSAVQIGKFFKRKRHHTTVLNGAVNWAVRHNLPAPRDSVFRLRYKK